MGWIIFCVWMDDVNFLRVLGDMFLWGWYLSGIKNLMGILFNLFCVVLIDVDFLFFCDDDWLVVSSVFKLWFSFFLCVDIVFLMVFFDVFSLLWFNLFLFVLVLICFGGVEFY